MTGGKGLHPLPRKYCLLLLGQWIHIMPARHLRCSQTQPQHPSSMGFLHSLPQQQHIDMPQTPGCSTVLVN